VRPKLCEFSVCIPLVNNNRRKVLDKDLSKVFYYTPIKLKYLVDSLVVTSLVQLVSHYTSGIIFHQMFEFH
jgi:hypothetical protein